MIDIHETLKLKTELLCKGLFLDESLIDHYKEQGLYYGRKGGAGPLGGRYFLLEDTKTLVNIALWDDPKRTNLVLKEKKGSYFEVYDSTRNYSLCKIKLIKDPKFYDSSFKTSDGIPMKKIALVHGIDCLGTTIYQKCKYWTCGEACKFCGIELSLEYDTTIVEKNHNQVNEVIAVAREEGRCEHITLTSGTEEGDDKGAKRYIELLKGIKERYPKLPIHVQIEPFEGTLDYMDELKEAGTDTIGIHIEILDNKLREIITPGKSKIPNQLFEDNWKRAVEIFGKNQVETYILTGFGESASELIADIEKLILLGVIPYITPVRSIPKVEPPMPVMNYNSLLEIYNKTAHMLKNYGLNPLENKAGCVRCGGCSAITEAYKAV